MTANDAPTAAPWVPSNPTLPKLIAAARQCQGCDLYLHATQTVFGAGPPKARVMMIGEQPGDAEDKAGAPFVGPAGKLLDRALVDARIDRNQVYVTNAVKHFKWIERGKRRIHSKPNVVEISACRPWLEAEMAVVQPELIVCLGATAAQTLLGRKFRITQQRGEIMPLQNPPHAAARILATVHPSSLLRAPDPETRRAEYALFVRDLARIPEAVRAVRLTG